MKAISGRRKLSNKKVLTKYDKSSLNCFQYKFLKHGSRIRNPLFKNANTNTKITNTNRIKKLKSLIFCRFAKFPVTLKFALTKRVISGQPMRLKVIFYDFFDMHARVFFGNLIFSSFQFSQQTKLTWSGER